MKSLCRKYCRGFFCEKQANGRDMPSARTVGGAILFCYQGPQLKGFKQKLHSGADLVNYFRKEKQKLLKRIKNTFDKN